MTLSVIEAITLVNDLNAKIFLLVVIAIYAIFAWWKFRQVEFSTLSNRIYKLALFIFSRITMFFYPFMVVGFLHINTTLQEMIIFVSGMYGIVFVTTFVFLLILGMEKVLDLLGIEKGGMYK